MSTSMRFRETMSGWWQKPGSDEQLPLAFTVDVDLDGRMRLFGTVAGRLDGKIEGGGLAGRTRASGTIEISPVEHRRIRYTLDFAGEDGSTYRFDGWKSINWLHAVETWTTLPGTITDESGEVAGTATLRFEKRDLPKFLGSMRLVRQGSARPGAGQRFGRRGAGADIERRRWRGEPGRLEVWYETFNDPATGTGFWLHHEIVAPTDGSAASALGWAAVFPSDGEPSWERFGPAPIGPGEHFAAGDVSLDPGRCAGKAGSISWDLTYEDSTAPLYTFSRLAWRRPVLPAAHVVSAPAASFTGSVRTPSASYELEQAPGAAARIFGHGNAERWGWLHADLGQGDTLEIVAAVGRRPGLSKLRPLPLVQLRLGGRDWPRNPLLAAPWMRAELGLPRWTVKGVWGSRRIEVTVNQPADRSVTIPYTDPDGSTATCVNSERADVSIELWRREGSRWVSERTWELTGTAHSEVGTRP